MTKQDLEKRVLEQEQRLLGLISGNIKLMSDVESLKAENIKLRNETENVLDLLRKRDDELYNEIVNINDILLNGEHQKHNLAEEIFKMTKQYKKVKNNKI